MVLLGEIRRHHSSQPVDETNDGYKEDEHPPAPENEEEFLIEQIVLESAEEVLGVGAACGRSPVYETGDLEFNQVNYF